MLKNYYLKISMIKEEVIEGFSNNDEYKDITNAAKKKEKIARDILFKHVVEKENLDSTLVFNQYGKPDFKDSTYHFNISHSNDMCLMSLSDEEIGVDVQYIQNFEEDRLDRLTRRVYNDNDYNFYNTDDNTTFTQIWTIKEAYLKYIGLGLIKNIHDIVIDYEANTVVYANYPIAKYITCYCDGYIASFVGANLTKKMEKNLFKERNLCVIPDLMNKE